MARRTWDDPWKRYAESVPIPVEGGLATSKQRGAMAEQWWSQRFVSVLEGFGLGARMQRGRRYARAGQVLSLEVRAGQLLAQVQGSRRTPYLVTVDPAPITDAGWASVDAALAARVVFAARLLAGEVPSELEAVFDEVGVALLPRVWRDLRARCSCPDPENPCKHIAAVLYVFADQLDDDPWLLLAWRGRTREQVLAALAVGAGGAREDPEGRAGGAGDSVGDEVGDEVAPWWPLTPGATSGVDAGGDGTGASGDAPDPAALVSADAPDPPAAVLARLDGLDAEVKGAPVVDLVEAAYPAIIDGR